MKKGFAFVPGGRDVCALHKKENAKSSRSGSFLQQEKEERKNEKEEGKNHIYQS
jgi:hypothetical protein